MCGARDSAVQAVQGHRVAAAGQTQDRSHLGDRPDSRVLALVHRHEEHALGVADVNRQRHRHAREDHGVFEWDQQQIRQELSLGSTVVSTSTVEVR